MNKVMTHKQVLVIRKDLKMRRGKEIAQGAHASLGAILSVMKTDILSDKKTLDMKDSRINDWIDGTFTKICVYVNSEKELLDLSKQVLDDGIINCLIRDNGLTEFHNTPTFTVLAIGPDTCEVIDKYTQHLNLY